MCWRQFAVQWGDCKTSVLKLRRWVQLLLLFHLKWQCFPSFHLLFNFLLGFTVQHHSEMVEIEHFFAFCSCWHWALQPLLLLFFIIHWQVFSLQPMHGLEEWDFSLKVPVYYKFILLNYPHCSRGRSYKGASTHLTVVLLGVRFCLRKLQYQLLNQPHTPQQSPVGLRM